MDFKNNQKKLIIAGIVVLVVTVIVIVVIYKFKDIKDLVVDHNANQKLVDELNKEIKADDITLTQVQLNACASKLYAAMKGAGTNEKKIYEVFEMMKTRSDVLQLIKTFGIKDGENLNEWLLDDCSASEISHINEILATNNINYQF